MEGKTIKTHLFVEKRFKTIDGHEVVQVNGEYFYVLKGLSGLLEKGEPDAGELFLPVNCSTDELLNQKPPKLQSLRRYQKHSKDTKDEK